MCSSDLDFAGLRECRVHCTPWIFGTVAVILVWIKTINYRFQHVYQRQVLRTGVPCDNKTSCIDY